MMEKGGAAPLTSWSSSFVSDVAAEQRHLLPEADLVDKDCMMTNPPLKELFADGEADRHKDCRLRLSSQLITSQPSASQSHHHHSDLNHLALTLWDSCGHSQLPLLLFSPSHHCHICLSGFIS